MTLIGGITGYLLGMIIAYLASMALPFSVRPDLMTVSLAIGISVFIGVVFSYFPASAASKRLDRYYEININSKETAIFGCFLVKVEKIQRFQEVANKRQKVDISYQPFDVCQLNKKKKIKK